MRRKRGRRSFRLSQPPRATKARSGGTRASFRAALERLEARLPLAADVIINEIMFHAATGDPGHEYIELFNRGDQSANLAGWRIDKGIDFTIPSATLNAGQYLVIAADLAKFQSLYPGVSNVVGGWTGQLSNSSNTIELVNSANAVIDKVSYADSGDWAFRERGRGRALVETLTRSGSTATVTIPGHGYSNGDTIQLSGADQPEYNGTFTVAGVTASTFTITVSGSPATTATGHIISRQLTDLGHQGWNWTSLADGLGSSLELVNPNLPNDFGQNWAFSTPWGGTPGAVNSKFSTNIAPMVLNLQQSPVIPKSTDAVTISAKLLDELGTASAATLYYRIDAASPAAFTAAPMHDDGLNGDALAGDGIWSAVVPPQVEGMIVEFYVSATDGTKTRTWPGPTDSLGTQGANLLYQVDNTPYSGVQPLFKLIMTDAERQELATIGLPGSTSQNSNAQMNGTFISVDSTESDLRYSIGIRNRGGGSRDTQPNNYRIDFNTDQQWKNAVALNLNGRYSMEEIIGSAVFTSAGLPAQSGVAAQVRVNNTNLAVATFDMFGSYSALESEDADFVNNHFPLDSGGNYYRGAVSTHLANLAYLGTNPDLYRPNYSKQNNTEDDDWTDLINLTKTLDSTQTPDAVFPTQLQTVMDVGEWLKYFAVSTLIGTQETTLSTGFGDDYSLYRGTTDTRFQIIVHDLDTILGRGDTAANLSESIFRAANLASVSRILKNAQFAPQYFAAILDQINTTFAPGNIEPLIDNTLAGYVSTAVRQTMKTFVTNRVANVRTQIPLKVTATTTLAALNGYPHTTGTTVNLTGLSNAVKTRSVLVGGVAATWSAWQAQWTANNVPLLPGINRILVQSLDANGVEFDRTYIDVWREVAPTSVSGTLPAGTTHWSTGTGPYRVTANLTVPSGATLQIDPGVSVFFDAGVGLTVSGTGRLNAQGTDLQRIRFTKTPGAAGPWSVITITSQQDNQLTFLDQEFAGSGTLNISLSGAVANIDHVVWLNTTTRILDIANTSFKLTNSIIPATVNVQPLDYHTAFPAGGYAIIQGNTFGKTTGQNDVVDFTGGNRPGAIVQILDNTFLGSDDDILDLDGTDAQIERNVFMNDHVTNLANTDTASAISGGKNGTDTSEWTIIGNYFYDCDHAVLAKEGAFATLINNTIVRMTYSAINFDEPLRAGIVPGKGAYLDGNIIWDTPLVFENVNSDGTTTDITVRHSDLQTATIYPGAGNTNLDPQLLQASGVTDPRTQLVLRSGPGPAVGTGPNGRDMGANVSTGASIAGEPASPTSKTTATLTVGGPDIYAYQYRVNGGAWSSTVAVANPGLSTAVVPPIVLSGLTNGNYTVQLIAQNSAGVWQATASATTSRTWTVNTALAPRLRISEVLAENDTTLLVNGSKPDLVELHNEGASSVDISGMAITDTAGNRKFTFPAGTILSAGEYRILYGDAAVSPPGTKLNFSFKVSGEGVFLYDTLAAGGALLDSVVFGQQLTDRSLARHDDGTWSLGIPTFGSANLFATTADPHLLKINEWFTTGTGADFIEVYNPSSLPVDMGNFYLSDDPVARPNRQQLAPFYFVPGGGKTVFIADGTPASGDDHLGFKLTYEHGQIALFDASLNRVDEILYGPQQLNQSQGRSPNGGSLFQFFATPNSGVDNPLLSTNVIGLRDEWTYFQTGAPAATWNTIAGPSPNWNQIGGGLLYVSPNTLPGPKTTALTLTSGRVSYYFRKHFTLDVDPATVQLTLNTMIDDGAVFYLNGHEAYRLGMPTGTITDTTLANRTVTDAAFEGPFVFPTTWLVKGDNVIAVEVHQQVGTSNDVVFGMTLDAVITPAAPPPLRISEINYHPYAPPAGSPYTADDFEFVEMVNTGAAVVNLQNARLASAVDFTFPNVNINPGQRVLVVKNSAAFATRYNTAGLTILGQYTGTLSDSSDDVVLLDKLNQVIDEVDYNNTDPWPNRAAGEGSTLEIIDLAAAGNDPHNWRPSYEYGGSPGIAGTGPTNRVVVNEVLTHTDLPQLDAIELYNTTASSIDIGGWYLSDSSSNYQKFRIPTGTSIGAGQYLVFDETAFNAAMPVGNNVSFRLSAAGDDVWLVSAASPSNLTAFEDHADFGAAINGESFGRWTDGTGELYPMKTLTLGSHNSGPRIGPIDISEIMYNPAGGNSDLEFVELKNLTNQTVALSNTFAGVGTIPWKIDGIGFNFPIGASIGPHGTLVVVHFDPSNPADANKLADFRAAYGIGAEVQLVGPYSGLLDNSGERIRLLRPDAPPADDPTAVPYILMDEVNYQNVAPWPSSPNSQNGNSLTRVEATIYGDDATNWIGAPATPGSSNLSAPTIIAGDFDLDGQRTPADIQSLLQALVDVPGYQTAHGISDAAWQYIGDFTGDLSVRNTDIQPLLDLLAAAQAAGAGSSQAEANTVQSSTISSAAIPVSAPAVFATVSQPVPQIRQRFSQAVQFSNLDRLFAANGFSDRASSINEPIHSVRNSGMLNKDSLGTTEEKSYPGITASARDADNQTDAVHARFATGRRLATKNVDSQNVDDVARCLADDDNGDSIFNA